jgi:hypothetical protein
MSFDSVDVGCGTLDTRLQNLHMAEVLSSPATDAPQPSNISKEQVQYPRHPRWVKRRIWLLRRARRIGRRRHWKKHCGLHGDKALPETNQHTARSIFKDANRKLVIRLPVRLDLEDNYETTVSHLALLRKVTKAGWGISELAFDAIQYISPTAALLLVSECDCWNRLIGGKLRAQVWRWNKDITRLLMDMGYFDLLKLPKPPSDPVRKNTTFLKFIRGRRGGDPGALAKQLRVQIEEIVGAPILRTELFEGLSEAITNVSHHAYPVVDRFSMQYWWLSASYDRDVRELTIVFYDHGVGIPVTLPNSRWKGMIRRLFNKADSAAIKTAMAIGRTRTLREERGKGLNNFISFGRGHKEGALAIYSRRGLYKMQWKHDDSRVKYTTTKLDHANSIGGTLVVWTVLL